MRQRLATARIAGWHEGLNCRWLCTGCWVENLDKKKTYTPAGDSMREKLANLRNSMPSWPTAS
eukprot:1734619-Pyramimonas_sp.AAC.1